MTCGWFHAADSAVGDRASDEGVVIHNERIAPSTSSSSSIKLSVEYLGQPESDREDRQCEARR